MSSNSNLTSLYASLINYFHEHQDGGDETAKEELFKELYQSLFQGENNSNFHEFLSGDIFIGEEVGAKSVSYMNLRPHVYGSILIAMTLLGVLCCVLVFWFVGKRHKVAPSSARVLVLNLAASCTVFLIGGVPLLLVENVFGFGWKLGHLTCQIHRYIFYASFYLIAYSQTGLQAYLLAFTAYSQSITNKLSSRTTAVMVALFWILVFVANIPNFLGHGVDEQIPGVSYCFHVEITHDIKQVIMWTGLQFTFTYAIPVLSMLALTIAQIVICCNSSSRPGEYLTLQENTTNKTKVTIIASVLTAVFFICWGPDKIFSLLLLLHPRRMHTPLLIASDVMMCVAYCQPTLAVFTILVTRIDDHVTPQEVKTDQSKAIIRPSCRVKSADEAKDDSIEPMMISTV